MLKIKDNIDLKELEKFGFEKFFKYYDTNGIKEIIGTTHITVDSSTNELIVFYSAIEDCSVALDNVTDLLFDLIKAGLVEKVKENGN